MASAGFLEMFAGSCQGKNDLPNIFRFWRDEPSPDADSDSAFSVSYNGRVPGPPVLLSLILLGTDARGASILERCLDAHGGLAAFHAIRSWHIVAERRLESKGEPPRETYEEYLLRQRGAERTLLIKRRPDSLLVFGHDGREGFALVDGKRRQDAAAAGEAYYRAHGEYYLRALPFKWKDPGVDAAFEDETELGGRPAYLVRVTAAQDVGVAWKDVWRAVIDKENYLLLEARLTHDRSLQTWMEPPQRGTSVLHYRFGDLRPVGRLHLPFRMEYWSEGKKTGENRVETWELGYPLEPGFFRAETHLRDTVIVPPRR